MFYSKISVLVHSYEFLYYSILTKNIKNVHDIETLQLKNTITETISVYLTIYTCTWINNTSFIITTANFIKKRHHCVNMFFKQDYVKLVFTILSQLFRYKIMINMFQNSH